MPSGAYRVSDLPARGAEAFLPVPPPVVTPPGLSSWGLVRIMGSPGTTQFSAPRPHVANTVTVSADPKTDPSKVSAQEFPGAPLDGDSQTWEPAIYVALPDHMGPQAGAAGVAVRHHEDIPVPAVDIRRFTTPVQRTPPYLGGKVTPWPRVFPRFAPVAPT